MPDTKSDSLITPEVQTAIDRYLPYLEDIRKKILIVLGVFIGTAAITGFNYQWLIKLGLRGFDLRGINMVLTSPNQILQLGVTTGMFCGLILTAPLVLYFLLNFLKPALSPKEYKLIISLLPASFFLFLFGFAFGIWTMRFIVSLFAQTAVGLDMSNLWDISQFFNQVVVSGLLLGFLFQFPVILTVLLRLHVLTRQQLAKQRAYVYTGILIVAAILPPTDIFSLLFLTIPLFLLFEITLLLNKKA